MSRRDQHEDAGLDALLAGAWQAGADAVATALGQMGAVWSPDFGAYASGQLDASAVRCVLCGHAPCDCPPFGTAAYLALVDRLHGRAGERGAR